MVSNHDCGPRTDTASPSPDDLIPLSDLPRYLPRRGGKKRHIASCHRWASVGIHGVVLRTVSIGGQRCTRMTWVAEWAERVAAARLPAQSAPRSRHLRRGGAR